MSIREPARRLPGAATVALGVAASAAGTAPRRVRREIESAWATSCVCCRGP